MARKAMDTANEDQNHAKIIKYDQKSSKIIKNDQT